MPTAAQIDPVPTHRLSNSMPRKSTVYWTLVFLSWAVFVASLFLPSVVVDLGAWNKPDRHPALGLAHAIHYWPSWPSNLTMFFAPLVSFLLIRFSATSTSKWIHVLISLFLAGSSFFAAKWYFDGMFVSVHIGYVVWCISFVLMAFAFLVVPPRAAQLEHDRKAASP